MSNKRIIEVSRCIDCPYHIHKHGEGPCRCSNLGNSIILVEEKPFPKECPLPEKG